LVKAGPNDDGAGNGSIALTRFGRKKFCEFVGSAVEFLGVGRRLSLSRYIWPRFGVFSIQLKPKSKVGFGVRLDGFRRAFRLADAAVNALVRMNDEHIVALIEAIDRTHLHAVQVFAFYAVFNDHISHTHFLMNGPARQESAPFAGFPEDPLAPFRKARFWRALASRPFVGLFLK